MSISREVAARELEFRISDARTNGSFHLQSGMTEYLQGMVWANGMRQCRGCALAAAAFVLSKGLVRARRSECFAGAMSDASLGITKEEAAQLEMGFEGWPDTTGVLANERPLRADGTDPFYQLGVRLAYSVDNKLERDRLPAVEAA